MSWRRRSGLILGLGGTVAVAALAWALWPLGEAPTPHAPLEVSTDAEFGTETPPSFPRQAFAARIWNPAPPPVPPPASVAVQDAPARPPRLQLIGIARDVDDEGNAVLRAALYDPDTDRIHLVASGEAVVGIAVAAVDETGVDLAHGGRSTRLVLRRPTKGGDAP